MLISSLEGVKLLDASILGLKKEIRKTLDETLVAFIENLNKRSFNNAFFDQEEAKVLNELFDLKVKIKPVLPLLIHSGAYEGPCRVGDEKTLDPEFERLQAMKNFEGFCEKVRSGLTEDGELLDPAVIEWGEDWIIPEEEMAKLDKDSANVDLYLIANASLTQHPSVEIARRYGKPIVKLGQVSSVDISAYLRSRGMEGYAFIDLEELNRFVRLFKVRKSLMNTRILIVDAGRLLPSRRRQ